METQSQTQSSLDFLNEIKTFDKDVILQRRHEIRKIQTERIIKELQDKKNKEETK